MNSFLVDGKQFKRELVEQNQFTVRSARKSYQVSWDETSHHPFEKINQLLSENPGNLLLIDATLLQWYGQYLSIDNDRIFALAAAESDKTLATVTAILDFLHRHDFTKSETLIVVGGGVIQELGGFASACYKRGIHWVHFPTTLLAMCDSCIGGKTSINFQQTKNQLGLFYPPAEVVIHPHFLKTLPEQALQSGLGEILKMAVIGGKDCLDDYHECVQNGRVLDAENYKKLILNALSVKRAVVEEDEFETNYRKCLNYGHTFGHAIEALSDFVIPHGITVVLGMLLVNELSVRQGLLAEDEMHDLNLLGRDLLDEQTLSVFQSLQPEAVLELVRRDKKVEHGEVSFVLLKTVGEMQFVKFPLAQLLRVCHQLNYNV